MKAVIRRARPGDADAVAALVDAAYSPYIARNGKRPGPMLDDYAMVIAEQRVHVLEDSDSTIIGVVVLIAEPDAMLLDNVAVSPKAQGRGFGVELISFAERCAREAGLPSIRLYTQDIMVENIALYTRLGFVKTHRAHQNGLDRVYMMKRLMPQ